jgi:hypothetical protein
MVLVYDRPLLRSSARGDGALASNNDRFAILLYGHPERAPEFCHLSHGFLQNRLQNHRGIINTMSRYSWSKLNTQQVGAYFEYFMKMEFAMYGFEVYTSEVDDRGIDFIARKDGGAFLEVQSKCLRKSGYIFMRKSHFQPRKGLYVAVGYLVDGSEPVSYLIPSEVWKSPSSIFVDRDYDKPGQQSQPEWGINFSRKKVSHLSQYSLQPALERLAAEQDNARQ